jgi:hypothetical protein
VSLAPSLLSARFASNTRLNAALLDFGPIPAERELTSLARKLRFRRIGIGHIAGYELVAA